MRQHAARDSLRAGFKRNRYVYWAARKARARGLKFVSPREYPGIPGRIHPNDFMLEERSPAGVDRYRERALNVLEKIEECLEAAGRGWEEPRSWLDFGCGYGRVLRFLIGHVSPGRVYAGDVIREAVDFCASEFGARPLHLDTRPKLVDLPEVDFLYAVSIVTHLTERDARETLNLFGNALRPGGVALFTTHGRRSLEQIELYGQQYVPLRNELESRVEERGIAFVPYPYALRHDYGMTWHSEAYVRRTMAELHGASLELLLFEAHGLDGHQDVFAFRRVAEPGRLTDRSEGRDVTSSPSKTA
jgi:SAM-dependent methyltransferase